jgi:hypothetical protein
MMTPIILTFGLVACLAGFLSCVHAVALFRRRGPYWPIPRLSIGRTKLVGTWFFGMSILLVNATMGYAALVPWLDAHLTLGILAWSALCWLGIVIHRQVHLAKHRREWRVAVILALGLMLTLSGCSAMQGHDPAFVSSMDLTQRAVGPEYLTYVAADASLDPSQKLRRQRTVAIWRSTIDEALNPGAASGSTQPTTQPAH